MHQLSSSFVLGYHGCDESVADALLRGAPFKVSQNDYDWLGEGIYFWEANPLRGLEWARENSLRPRSKIKVASVIDAVIDLRLCLDLTTTSGIAQVQAAYEELVAMYELLELYDTGKMPINDKSRKLHNLDCAVINTLHDIRDQKGLTKIDTVKGVFVEGQDIYQNSAFNSKTHIQICVRNPNCIRGVFRVPNSDLAYSSPILPMA